MEAIIWETKEELVRKLAQRVRNIRKRCSISQQKLAAINATVPSNASNPPDRFPCCRLRRLLQRLGWRKN